jgi:ABC-type bacteriocin/lantibiotic exporter with double-glycine peptidase domain
VLCIDIMKYQKDSYSCGAAAVVNALRCFGRKVSEMKVRGFSDTSSEGTSEAGIVQALKGLGFDGTPFDTPDADKAIKILHDCSKRGEPVIICVQNLQHWVTVIGVLDQSRRYIISDPAKTVRNMAENGVHVVSEKEIRKTWQCRNGNFFGIICCRKKRK